MPVRRRWRQRAAGPHDRADRPRLALLPARRAPGAALRLPRPRPYEPDRRPSVQPDQAADRPVRQADRRHRALGRRAVRLPHRRRRRPSPTIATRAAFVPKSVVVNQAFVWGDDRAAAHAAGPHAHLRGPRQGLHQAASRGARGAARHVRRAGLGAGDRLPDQPRHHRGRAAAGPPARRRAAPRRARPVQLLGLQHDRLLRARRALLRPPASR